MPEFFRCEDVLGRTVVLSAENWFYKILLDHPEPTDMEEAIIDSLEDPDERRHDKTSDDREVFYKSGMFAPPYHDQLLKVIGAYISIPEGGEQGRIVTAYPVDIIPRGERPIWIRSRRG
jgi:hypothetical protein